MKKLILSGIALTVLLMAKSAAAQDYKNAIGVRLGSYNGVNFKTFVDKDRAFDLNLSFRDHNTRKDIRFTALYEIHDLIENAEGINWYYGAGGSIGSREFDGDNGKLLLSADGVVGLDYKFPQAPFNLAIDWRPRFEIVPDPNVSAGDFGLSVRFTF